jgi:hypothetical protein
MQLLISILGHKKTYHIGQVLEVEKMGFEPTTS